MSVVDLESFRQRRKIDYAINEAEGKELGWLAKEVGSRIYEQLPRVVMLIRNSNILRALDGKDLQFLTTQGDLDLGIIFSAGRTGLHTLQFIVSDNVAKTFAESMPAKNLESITEDVSLYMAGYCLASTMQGIPLAFKSHADVEFWQGNIDSDVPKVTIEPYRFAAGVLELARGSALSAEVPEGKDTPLYALSLADPMNRHEVVRFAPYIGL